jgi:hypothetical protein
VNPIASLLNKLHDSLSTFASPLPDRVPLSPSLINYVFFPLAQLLRNTTKGEADLPDRVRQVVFQILSSLANDWWQTWTDCTSPPSADSASRVKDQWKVWEQLLILGAVAMGGPPDGKSEPYRTSSEETQMAICSFLQELLLPRLAIVATASTKVDQEWEWDGEEELPSLDDYDQFQEATFKRHETEGKGVAIQVYPSSGHLEHVFSSKGCRGAIAHALTASLDLASASGTSAVVKVACLKVSRTIISSWLADKMPHMENSSSLFKRITVEKVFGSPRTSDKADSEASTQADRVAVFLPGYVSSMVRILGSASTRDNSQVISQALLSLAAILQVCLCDAASEGLTLSRHTSASVSSSQAAASIDELVARVNIDGDQRLVASDISESEEKPHPKLRDDPSKRNNEWLDNTIAHVVIALYSVDPIVSHSNSQVQIATIHLAHALLAHCSSILGLQQRALLQHQDDGKKSIDATRLLLRWIVDVAASDTSMESAIMSASDCLRLLFSSHSDLYKHAIIEEMLELVQSIPALLASQNDDDTGKKANRLRFLLSLSTSGFDSSIAVFEGVKKLLQPSSAADKWGTTLLWSLKVDDRASMEHDTTLYTMQGLSPSASRAVLRIFEEMGRCICRLVKQDCSAGVDVTAPFDLIWSFMDQASANRSTLMTASGQERYSRVLCQNALIVVDRMTQGVSELLDDASLAVQTSKEGKKVRRVAHRFAKEMVRRVSDLWAEDEEELLQQDVSARQENQENRSTVERSLLSQEHHDESELSTVERRSGVGEQQGSALERPAGFGPALKLDFVGPATLTASGALQAKTKSPLQLQTEAKVQLDRSDALLLSILTSSSRVLGPALKPLLLKMLYPIICGVASQSSAIRGAAMQSIDEMARSAGYASVQGCVLDHADYVLGTASHRLVSTLGQELQAVARRSEGDEVIHFPLVSAQSAPLVLVEIIRMLGGEALTLVQDAIDEVLDAIDQEVLCDDLLNVLSRLVAVMLEDERLKDGQDRKAKHPMVNSASIAFHPDVDRDMEELQKWWRKRQSKEESNEEPAQAEGEAPEDDSPSLDEPDTSSPSQAVVVSILEKAVPFLSHSSAMIRIRCLKLLNEGIELLCLQGRTVEPLQVINKAWPAIMGRLGFSLSLSLPSTLPTYQDLSERDFVACTEAAKLVTTLAKYLVEYLGPKKMLQQAVPRLLLLLKIVERAEGRIQQGRQSNARTFLLKDEPTVSPALQLHSFKPLQRFTPLYAMTETVFTLLDTLIEAMGPHLTEADLYQFAVHPILLSCLDKRQDDQMLKLAQHFYFSTLSRRNENLVWLVLSASQDTDNHFPAFLHRPELDLQW